MKISEKTKKIMQIAAGVTLCAVVSAAAIFGAMYAGGYIGGNSVELSSETAETEEADGGLIVSDSVNEHGISLLSTTLTAEEAEEYGISTASTDTYYVLKAVYNSTASTPEFTWSCSNTSQITLTPSSDTLSCTVTCSGAFTSQEIITCTYVYDTSVTATCTVDYYKRLTSSTYGIIRFVNSMTTQYQYTNKLDQSGETGIDSTTQTLPSFSSLSFTTSYSLYYDTGSTTEDYTVDVSLYSYITKEEWTDTYYTSTSSNGAILSNEAFCDCVFGYTGNTDSSLNDCYNAWEDANATYDIRVIMTFTGEKTGEVSKVTTFFKFNMDNLIVSVTSLELSETSIGF